MILKVVKSIVIVLFGAAAIFFLLLWNTAPSGAFHATWTPDKESPFIYGFGPPSSIVLGSGDKPDLSMVGERTTFSLKLPAKFKEIEMEIDYAKPVAPIFKILGKSGIGAIDFKERVLYSEAMEKKSGSKTQKNGFLVAGSRSEAEAAAALSGQIPVSTLGFRLEKSMGNGESRDRRINASLRGSHIFWLLPGGNVGNEIVFSVQDMNRNKEADPITVEVSSRGRVLKKVVFDDSAEDRGNLPGEVKEIKIFLPKITGPLKVLWSASDDIFIRSLATDAARLVVEDRIFFGDDVGFGGSDAAPMVWTDGSFIRAKTPHREGLQKISFAGRQLDLGRTDEYGTIVLNFPSGGITAVRVQKNDVELVTSGFFAFSPDDFFAPAWPEVSWTGSVGNPEIIVASYESPSEELGVLTSRVKFAADELAPERDGSYRFFFDLPGADAFGARVNIRQIKVTASK